MLFPFTFNFHIPGIINPFSSTATSVPGSEQDTRTNQSPTNGQRASQTLSKHITAPSSVVESVPESAPPYPTAYSVSYPVPTLSSNGGLRTTRAQLPKINRPRPSPTPSPAPLSRKRGWEPEPSPNWSTASLTLASSSGYLDTPAKYRQMAASSQSYGHGENTDIPMNDEYERGYDPSQDGNQEYEDDMPPLKKRRGLAGSIVSTAVSAALIGTAVGLTVYRLWRDRGKDPQILAAPHEDSPDPSTQPPPPPYQEKNEWQPLERPAAIRVAPPTPGTPRSAARHHAAKRRQAIPTAKRPVVHRPTRRTRPAAPSAAPAVSRPEFDFERDQEDVDGRDVVEDKMDWLGDKLSMLIEQGKRALNTEVVVMSDAKEDEVDDGSGAWEEAESDDDHSNGHQGRSKARDTTGSGLSSRANSIRASSTKRVMRPMNIIPPPSGVGLGLYGVEASSSASLSASPRRAGYMHGHAYAPSPASTSTSYASASAGFTPGSVPSVFYDTPRRTHVRGLSYETALPSSASAVAEDSAAWESPEIRESMERARARLMARRAGAGV